MDWIIGSIPSFNISDHYHSGSNGTARNCGARGVCDNAFVSVSVSHFLCNECYLYHWPWIKGWLCLRIESGVQDSAWPFITAFYALTCSHGCVSVHQLLCQWIPAPQAQDIWTGPGMSGGGGLFRGGGLLDRTPRLITNANRAMIELTY